ncbi:2955_t:CDS:1, partial [Paraglomus occultum]
LIPTKMECLYQYAVENDRNPENFQLLLRLRKIGCFRDGLERDIRFYRGGIERQEDTRKF